MIVWLLKMAEQGGYLPRWPSGGGYTGSMFGTPADIVIAESYLKGIRDFDVESAYQFMRKTALGLGPAGSPFSSRVGVEHDLKYGFCPKPEMLTYVDLRGRFTRPGASRSARVPLPPMRARRRRRGRHSVARDLRRRPDSFNRGRTLALLRTIPGPGPRRTPWPARDSRSAGVLRSCAPTRHSVERRLAFRRFWKQIPRPATPAPSRITLEGSGTETVKYRFSPMTTSGSDPPSSRYTLKGSSPDRTVPFENGSDVIVPSKGKPSSVFWV